MVVYKLPPASRLGLSLRLNLNFNLVTSHLTTTRRASIQIRREGVFVLVSLLRRSLDCFGLVDYIFNCLKSSLV